MAEDQRLLLVAPGGVGSSPTLVLVQAPRPRPGPIRIVSGDLMGDAPDQEIRHPPGAVRNDLHRRGLRFVVDRPVPGGNRRRRSDILLRGARIAVFVDGCFWHPRPEHSHLPKTNTNWWRLKVRGIAAPRPRHRHPTRCGGLARGQGLGARGSRRGGPGDRATRARPNNAEKPTDLNTLLDRQVPEGLEPSTPATSGYRSSLGKSCKGQAGQGP